MKRWLRSVLSLVVLFGAAALISCGGGGSDEFDFSGTWLFHETVSQNSGMESFPPPGSRGEEFIILTQNDTTLVLTPEGSGTGFVGTCNPDDGTFRVAYASGPLRFVITGARTGDDTMSGEMNFEDGRASVKVVYTADRL